LEDERELDFGKEEEEKDGFIINKDLATDDAEFDNLLKDLSNADPQKPLNLDLNRSQRRTVVKNAPT
jgi:hypothetical protein